MDALEKINSNLKVIDKNTYGYVYKHGLKGKL